MIILGGKLTAPNSPASCGGCSCMLKWWDRKNTNDPFARAVGSQSLRQMMRWRFLLPGWWGSGLPGRRSGDLHWSVLAEKVTGPPTVWARANGGPWLGNLHFPGRMDAAKVGLCQTRKETGDGHYSHFVAQLPDWIPLEDLGRGQRPTWPCPCWS